MAGAPAHAVAVAVGAADTTRGGCAPNDGGSVPNGHARHAPASTSVHAAHGVAVADVLDATNGLNRYT